MLTLRDKFKIVGLAVGIFLSYVSMGVCIEKLFMTDFDGEKFTFSIAFVAAQCILYMIVAKVIILLCHGPPHDTPQKYYIFSAIFYTTGMVTALMALSFVSYPMEVVVKACKPIPVMICGVLIVRNTYTIQKYVCVLMIVIGVGMFIYKNDYEESSPQNGHWNWGTVLIGVSLLSDGLRGASQDMMRKISKPTTFHFMMYLNAWSSLILTVIFLVNNEGIEFIKFTIRHHEILLYFGCVLVTGTFGQIFVSSMVTNFGSLPAAIVSTLKNIFIVLLSCLIFKSSLTIQQWTATAIIFGALIIDLTLGGKKCCIKSKKAKNDENLHLDEIKIKTDTIQI